MGNFYTLRKAYEAMISEAAESEEEEGAEQFDKNDPLPPELPDPDSEEEINEDLAMKLSDPVRIEIANTMNKVTKIVKDQNNKLTGLIYEKDGKQETFTLENYPKGDSTWHFVDQKSVLVKKGMYMCTFFIFATI